jgi:hypothetical protein
MSWSSPVTTRSCWSVVRPVSMPHSPALGAASWQRYSCGQGAKGHRYYDWAWIGLDGPRNGDATGHARVLARRSIADPSALAVLGHPAPDGAWKRCSRPPRTRPQSGSDLLEEWRGIDCFRPGVDQFPGMADEAWCRIDQPVVLVPGGGDQRQCLARAHITGDWWITLFRPLRARWRRVGRTGWAW